MNRRRHYVAGMLLVLLLVGMTLFVAARAPAAVRAPGRPAPQAPSGPAVSGPAASELAATRPAATRPAASGPAASGQAQLQPAGVWPLDPVPEVLAGFDPPGAPWGAGHRGVDLAGTAGQAVRAALAGTVSYAGRIAGRGVVVVDHGETRTTYEPVAAGTPVGTAVRAGAVIGTLELAAGHCLPRACLHWGLRRGEDYLDPLTLVAPTPVRLLPLWRPEPVAVTRAPVATMAASALPLWWLPFPAWVLGRGDI